jgi:hypothetical protein
VRERQVAVKSSLEEATRLVSLTGAALFVLLLSLLHLVRSDLDPARHFISEYELGPAGWIMRAAFASLSISSAVVAVFLLLKERRVSAYMCAILLAVSAIGMALAAIVAPGAPSGLHDIGASMDLLPFGVAIVSLGLGGSEFWKTRRLLLWALGLLPLLGFVVFMMAMARNLPGGKAAWDPIAGAPIGWANRGMILAQAAWIILVLSLWRPAARQARGVASIERPPKFKEMIIGVAFGDKSGDKDDKSPGQQWTGHAK